jgi:hypothetical protein
MVVVTVKSLAVDAGNEFLEQYLLGEGSRRKWEISSSHSGADEDSSIMGYKTIISPPQKKKTRRYFSTNRSPHRHLLLATLTFLTRIMFQIVECQLLM